MPVVINTNMMATLQKLGVTPVLLAELSKGNWKLTMQPDGVKFTKDGQPQNQYMVAVPSTKLMAAAKGMLDQTEVLLLRHKFNKAIKEMIDGSYIPAPDLVGAITPESLDMVVESSNTPKPAGLGAYNYMVPALNKHQPLSPTQMQNSDALPLSDATGLYAPVRGTDKSSKYFMLAVFEGFRVAGRLKSSKLSIRVEGDIPQGVRAAIGAIQFSPSEKHWSTHVMITSNDEANRYFGCALGTMVSGGGKLLTPMPDLKIIAGKGI